MLLKKKLFKQIVNITVHFTRNMAQGHPPRPLEQVRLGSQPTTGRLGRRNGPVPLAQSRKLARSLLRTSSWARGPHTDDQATQAAQPLHPHGPILGPSTVGCSQKIVAIHLDRTVLRDFRGDKNPVGPFLTLKP
jgi:hypothetical protein